MIIETGVFILSVVGTGIVAGLGGIAIGMDINAKKIDKAIKEAEAQIKISREHLANSNKLIKELNKTP